MEDSMIDGPNRSPRRLQSKQGILALATAFAMLSGCSTLGSSMTTAGVIFGMFRSPVVLPTNPPNRPLDKLDRVELESIADSTGAAESRYHAIDASSFRRTFKKDAAKNPTDAIDDFADLLDEQRQALVFVALSGGGARAASLSAHALALLEMRYNEMFIPADPSEEWPASYSVLPFASAIDAYSSVSGGSIYAYQVALDRAVAHACGTKKRKANGRKTQKTPRCAPSVISLDQSARLSYPTRTYLGLASAGLYFSPANLFYGPLSTTLTDNSYIEFLAHALHYSSWALARSRERPWPFQIRKSSWNRATRPPPSHTRHGR